MVQNTGQAKYRTNRAKLNIEINPNFFHPVAGYVKRCGRVIFNKKKRIFVSKLYPSWLKLQVFHNWIQMAFTLMPII